MEEKKHNQGQFSKENPGRAREMQMLSTEKKKENRDRRLALENCLAESVKILKEGALIERAKGTQMMRGLVDMALNGNLDAIKLILKVTGEMSDRMDLTSGGQPFEVKVVKVSEDMSNKINDYLNGSGSDGASV